MSVRVPLITGNGPSIVVSVPYGLRGRSYVPLCQVRSLKTLRYLCVAMRADLKALQEHRENIEARFDEAQAELSLLRTYGKRKRPRGLFPSQQAQNQLTHEEVMQRLCPKHKKTQRNTKR